MKKEVPDKIWGDPTLRAQMKLSEAKAGLLDTRRRSIEARFGNSAVDKICAHLSPELAGHFREPPYYTTWMNFDVIAQIDAALITHVFGGDTSKIRGIVETGAELELNFVYKFLLKLGSPAFMLKRLGVVFSSKARPGVLKEESIQQNDATMVMSNMILPYYYYEHVLPAWASVALTLTGAKNPDIQMTACPHWGDSLARYSVHWR